MKISFATTCMGRAHHLKQTLPQNIRDNLPVGGDAPDVEFVVLNYSSRDDLDAWIQNDPELAPHLDSGVIRYARYDDADYFWMSHAKNMAHRLATGDVVCNLDADNFTGPGFANFLADVFSLENDIVVHPSVHLRNTFPVEERGFFGRIAFTRVNFLALGGYDENLKKWGGDDVDMLLRSIGNGLSSRAFADKKFLRTISHSNEDRVRNMEGGIRKAALEEVQASAHPHFLEPLIMAFKLLTLRTVANLDGNFGTGSVLLGRDEEPELIGPAISTLQTSSTLCINEAFAILSVLRSKTVIRLNADRAASPAHRMR